MRAIKENDVRQICAQLPAVLIAEQHLRPPCATMTPPPYSRTWHWNIRPNGTSSTWGKGARSNRQKTNTREH